MQAAARTIASENSDWISGACRRFSDATGWLLEFVPHSGGGDALLDSALDLDAVWTAPIDDGERTIGRLRILPPDDGPPDWSFASVGDLADAFARLLRRCVAAERALDARTRELRTLVDIGRSLSQKGDPQHALGQLLRAACQLTGFLGAEFFLLDPSVQQLKLRGAHPVPFDGLPRTRMLRDHPPDLRALAEGPMIVARDGEAARWLPPGMATGVCLPVQSDDGPIGTLWVWDRRRHVPAERELHVLESIAAQLAAVLERSVLLRESAVQHRLKQELVVASEFQSGEITPLLPPEWNIEFAALCTSRWEIGGDLCELIPLGDDRLLIAIGDASGDSIPAALVMSAMRGALRSLIDAPSAEIDTADLTERLNCTLHGITPGHQFMSLLCGVLDFRARSFTYTNAGHPNPLHARGEAVLPLDSHGLLLGVLPDAAYKSSRIELAAGDLLVFYTDGFTEAMSRRRQMFRSEGIAEVLRRHPGASARAIHDAICAEVSEHTRGSDEADDRTLLVVRA